MWKDHQHVPELFAALKPVVDANRGSVRFILTGSSNVLLIPRLSDSLAGRMEILRLYPLSQVELERARPAFLSAIFAARFIFKFTSRATVTMSMAVLALGMFVAPFSGMEWIAVGFFLIMGTARGLGGIAITSSMMESVPKHMMGRVQNTFFFVGTLLQLVLGTLVGAVAYRTSLTAAFAIIGLVYVTASLLTIVPVSRGPAEAEVAQATEPVEVS